MPYPNVLKEANILYNFKVVTGFPSCFLLLLKSLTRGMNHVADRMTKTYSMPENIILVLPRKEGRRHAITPKPNLQTGFLQKYV